MSSSLDYHDKTLTYNDKQTIKIKKVLSPRVQGERARVPLLRNLRIHSRDIVESEVIMYQDRLGGACL